MDEPRFRVGDTVRVKPEGDHTPWRSPAAAGKVVALDGDGDIYLDVDPGQVRMADWFELVARADDPPAVQPHADAVADDAGWWDLDVAHRVVLHQLVDEAAEFGLEVRVQARRTPGAGR